MVRTIAAAHGVRSSDVTLDVQLYPQDGLFGTAVVSWLGARLPAALELNLESSPTRTYGNPIRVSLREVPTLSLAHRHVRDVPPLRADGAPVVLLADDVTDALITEAYLAGAALIVPKAATLDVLARTLCQVAVHGEALPLHTWFDTLMDDAPTGTANKAPRSRRPPHQHDLLDLVARGYSNRRIARTLSLSEGTVRNALSQAYLSMGVRNRTEAAVEVLRRDPSRLSTREAADGEWVHAP